MSFSIIVAASKNHVIGIDNRMPWHLPDDFRHFKEKTLGKAVIMGRKTYESIGKPLPNRRNIILTRDINYRADGCEVYHSVEDVMDVVNHDEENMVIGGGEIYRLFFPYADKVYLTEVDVVISGDTQFILPNNYVQVHKEKHSNGVFNQTETVDYAFLTYFRQA